MSKLFQLGNKKPFFHPSSLFLNGHQPRENDAGFTRSCSTRAPYLRQQENCSLQDPLQWAQLQRQKPHLHLKLPRKGQISSRAPACLLGKAPVSGAAEEGRRGGTRPSSKGEAELVLPNRKHKQKNWARCEDDEKEMNIKRKGTSTSTKLLPHSIPRLPCSSPPK